MLGPILQTLGNALGNAINNGLQSLSNAAGPAISNAVSNATQYIISNYGRQIGMAIAKTASDAWNNWYNSLSNTQKDKVDKAIFWVVKDLTGDIIEASTGLPIKVLVNKVFDIVNDLSRTSESEKMIEVGIKKEIKRQYGK